MSAVASDAVSYRDGREDQSRVPVLYKVADLAGEGGLLRMSRAYIYKQIKAGRLRTVKEGGATFITPAALADYVALLERESEDRT